jgi:hypothetical protein
MEEALLMEAGSLLTQYTAIEKKWEEAKAELQAHVLHLLETNLPALYQLLYKTDIAESKARQAFGSDTKTIADNLSELILKRILEKAKTRLAYKNK